MKAGGSLGNPSEGHPKDAVSLLAEMPLLRAPGLGDPGEGKSRVLISDLLGAFMQVPSSL